MMEFSQKKKAWSSNSRPLKKVSAFFYTGTNSNLLVHLPPVECKTGGGKKLNYWKKSAEFAVKRSIFAGPVTEDRSIVPFFAAAKATK
jgi:hypothetical protein